MWQWLIDQGLIQGEASYYSDGSASKSEYENAIKVALSAANPDQRKRIVDSLFDAGLASGDRTYWYESPPEGDANLIAVADNFDKANLPDNSTTTPPLDDVTPPDASEAIAGGIMQGGTIRLVQNPGGQEDYYIVQYQYPPNSGNSFYYRFDSLEQLEKAIGPNLGGGSIPVGPAIKESELATWVDGGNASEITDVSGSFEGYINDTIRESAILAGLGDPTLLGRALEDPDILLILAKTAEGDWSVAQVKAAMRQTSFYKDTLYPGIERFYNQTDNPEERYRAYVRNINTAAKKLGLAPGADGGYKALAGDLLNSGVSDVAFSNFVPTFQRAQTNVHFADALSKWTERYAGKPINNFSDWFDVLAGNSPAEISQIARAAGIQYLADNAGFNVDDVQLRALAEGSPLGENQFAEVFSRTTRELLSLGERGLRRGGITAQDVLNADAGVEIPGQNLAAIRAKVKKLAIEEGLIDDPSATFFTDFNAEGAPIKAGLQSSIAEGA